MKHEVCGIWFLKICQAILTKSVHDCHKVKTLNASGFGVYQTDHEDANGQFEINWHYQDHMCLCENERQIAWVRIWFEAPTPEHNTPQSMIKMTNIYEHQLDRKVVKPHMSRKGAEKSREMRSQVRVWSVVSVRSFFMASICGALFCMHTYAS